MGNFIVEEGANEVPFGKHLFNFTEERSANKLQSKQGVS